ncbi:MAG: type II secretion system GspH family protein [Fusobacterium sp.]|nr:type II secretion system GspH family protein [Fusobacterium sp.]
MAEILLSLTIIGVVAAITLPSLTGNINERTWNTQRKALYARFSQAIPLIDSLNTYANAEAFATDALSKVLKINNICDKDALEDCGIPTQITTLDAQKMDMPRTLSDLNDKFTNYSTNSDPEYSGWRGSYSQDDTDAAAFETQNGESIVLFYNPSCKANMGETSDFYTQSKICLNFIYDLNGTKGPNTVGKDIGFITAFYPSDSEIVAPVVNYHTLSDGIKFDEASALCNDLGGEYRMPNILELSAMFMNQKLIGITSGLYWSSSIVSANQAQYQSFNSGRRNIRSKNETNLVRCVQR